jgi:isochorismate synthase
MIATLRHRLAAPDLTRRLEHLAGDAPAAAPVSLRLELGTGTTDWLKLLPADSHFWYRARPERREFRLGIGHALQVASSGANRFAALDNALAGFCQGWRCERPALAFAGCAFAAGSEGALPNALLAIPAILLENIDGHCTLTLSVTAGRIAPAVAEWQHWCRNAHLGSATDILPARPQVLAEQAWLARVHAALRDIRAGRVDKLVLARSLPLESRTAFAPAAVLASLVEQQPGSTIYAHGDGQQTFLGATPERLVRLHGRQVEVDALAGTAWPGSAALDADKNRHEQALVVRAITAALAPLCLTRPSTGSLGEHAAGELRHLRSRITARARPGTTLFDLVRALHPTPAVGGYPSGPAQDWLAAHGEQRSAWYSGGFGLLDSAGNGEFSVALRSALLAGSTAELQAGAGIVAGSEPQQELAETEAKFGTLLAALAAPPPASRSGTGDR